MIDLPGRDALNRHNWPITAAMIQYPNRLPDGRTVQEQSEEEWARPLAEVADAGFAWLDPTDSWLRLADLSPARQDSFVALARAHGLAIPAISTARRSVIDPAEGEANLAYSHRVIDAAARIGAVVVSFGLMRRLSEAQQRALWFWTAPGPRDPDDPAVWALAVKRFRELARHAAEVGIEISLEMYEDTYLGTADSAVRLLADIDHPAVGLNPDLGNLQRLHRPVEHWLAMVEKTVPHANYWHVKNYLRTEDAATGAIVTAPAPMESGVISYRVAVAKAIAAGFRGMFCCEHYGGDGLSVSARNREYLQRILPATAVGAAAARHGATALA
jgi:sugar phosphate isomerase/epimerase